MSLPGIREVNENEERPECALPPATTRRANSKKLNRFASGGSLSSGLYLSEQFAALMTMAEDAVAGSYNFVLGKADKPRRYVQDRCHGKSSYRDHWRPPCPACYVPMPVQWFPDLLEQNPVMEYVGKLGCVRPYDHTLRKIIFGTATTCQLVAFAMTLFAALAISKDYDLLTRTSFTHGTTHIFNGTQRMQGWTFDLGLLGVAIQDPDRLIDDLPGGQGFHERVLKWDDFCDEFASGWEHMVDHDACHECGQQSKTLVGTMIMSLVFSIPTFTTDILRFYPDYDVSEGSRQRLYFFFLLLTM